MGMSSHLGGEGETTSTKHNVLWFETSVDICAMIPATGVTTSRLAFVGTNAVVLRSATTTVAQQEVSFSVVILTVPDSSGSPQTKQRPPCIISAMGQEAMTIGTPTLNRPKTMTIARERYLCFPCIRLLEHSILMNRFHQNRASESRPNLHKCQLLFLRYGKIPKNVPGFHSMTGAIPWPTVVHERGSDRLSHKGLSRPLQQDPSRLYSHPRLSQSA